MKYNSALTKKHLGGFNYFKNTLSTPELIAYEAIRSGLLAHDNRIPISGVQSNRIYDIYDKIKRDNPLLYHVERIAYQYVPFRNEGIVIPSYRFERKQVDATNQAIYERVKVVIQKCMNARDEEEKEKMIHDYLCSTVVYDNQFKDSSYECVGPLLFGKGVCEGISKAGKFLFDCVGLDSLVVHGRSKQNIGNNSPDSLHAWNLVALDGSFYHLDITFDLSLKMYGQVRYDYFNLSDKDILVDHEISEQGLPSCVKNKEYYSSVGALVVNRKSFYEYFKKCVNEKHENIVVRLPEVKDVNKAENELIIIAQRVLADRRRKIKSMEVSCNPGQRVFQLHVVYTR